MNNQILSIITNRTLTYNQKVIQLASCAESMITPIELTDSEKNYVNDKIICTMYEGNAPYRPRYVIADFENFMKKGSIFLGLPPPKNIHEAINSLLILYKHIPSITSFPVYIGNLDSLLNPFIQDEKEAEEAIRLFLVHIDKTITDSFCHGNIGPNDTIAGKILLKLFKELDFAIPNITLKVSDNTSKDFLAEAMKCAMHTAKPSFANDSLFRKDFNGDYAIASCYNGLKIGGGSHTLVRIILANLAKRANSANDFFHHHLPDAVKKTCSLMDKRVKFLVEKSRFFQSNFLVKENLVNLDNFTAMFGMVGLSECVNTLFDKDGKAGRFGHDKDADSLGLMIISEIDKLVKQHKAPYCKATNGSYVLHAQVGISDDKGISPGCRIPAGEESELFEHIMQSAPFHKYFPSGIGDIFVFDQTYRNTPNALIDIMKGCFSNNLRYISFYCKDCDVVRISGYLVKRSEIEKLRKSEAVLNDATVLGKEAEENLLSMNRKIRTSR
ncbi:MAG TPA: YjjI family glycine radical enzyme [Lentisphaeria bacterium]|nr:MAG: YjjI family glycine radical enzyme [Lentisphaerae bacterium GWF2_38_69]HBM15178.1 YjjI family glycine radical enzyme [Lentisphaeria bacterium]